MIATENSPRVILNEEIILFESRGNQLPGILTRPHELAEADLGVILLSPGLKHRAGPHRLHYKLAALFASRGLPVFRFDFHGTGDAQGELPGLDVPDLHERIQNGFFTADSLAALEVFCRKTGLTRVIACGLCGGAITGVYLAEADSRVDGIIGFQLPVKVLDLEGNYADQISDEFSDFILLLYLKKIFKPEAWRNFFSGKSEYDLIWKTMIRRLGRLVGRGKQTVQERVIPDGMNRIFLDAWDKISGRVKMFWIYSEQERARYDFEGDFQERCLAGREKPYQKAVIKESNHEFAPDVPQRELMMIIDGWLEKTYGIGEGKTR